MGGLPFGASAPTSPMWQQPAPVDPALAGAAAPDMSGPMSASMDGDSAPEPDSTVVTDASPTRRRRSLKLDAEKACRVVLERIERARDERSDWMTQRLVRYAKLRGWRQSQSWPWED